MAYIDGVSIADYQPHRQTDALSLQSVSVQHPSIQTASSQHPDSPVSIQSVFGPVLFDIQTYASPTPVIVLSAIACHRNSGSFRCLATATPVTLATLCPVL